MVFLKHLFGILTLQTGTILSSSLFITLAICVLLVNVLALDTEAPLAWIVIFLFNGYMIVIWLISLYGAYKESQDGITAATILWTIYIILWLKLVIFSYIDAKYVCLESRCPEVVWLLSNPWNEKHEECNDVFQNSLTNNSRSLYEKNNKPQMYDDRIKNEKKREIKHNVTTNSHYTTVSSVKFDKYETRSEIKTEKVKLALKKCNETPIARNNQGSMMVSIIVFLLYLLLLLFSWLILISYREELILQTNLTNNN